MIVTFRDQYGYTAVTVDSDGIGFTDGADGETIALFSFGDTEYRIPARHLISVLPW